MIYTYLYNTKTVFRSLYNDDRVDLHFYKQSPWVYIDSKQESLHLPYTRVFFRSSLYIRRQLICSEGDMVPRENYFHYIIYTRCPKNYPHLFCDLTTLYLI